MSLFSHLKTNYAMLNPLAIPLHAIKKSTLKVRKATVNWFLPVSAWLHKKVLSVFARVEDNGKSLNKPSLLESKYK